MARTPTSGAGSRASGREQRRAKRDVEFSRRVRFLIDKYDEGNVTAVARRIGVSQRALAKVYAGETTAPRLDLVQAVIRGYPAEDPVWILFGTSSDTEERIQAVAQQRALAMFRTAVAGVGVR